MTNKIINFEDLDFSKITFSKIKTNKYGSNTISMLYNGEIPRIKFPRMKVPFGVSTFQDQKSGNTSYTLEFSFDNKNENSKLKNLYKKALEFDEFILQSALKHYKEWFNDDEKPDLKYLKKGYTPFVKVPMDKQTKKPLDYDSRCKCTIYTRTGSNDFSFKLYDE